ncbi:uncharacterized protein VTP21DRAFT_4791 [Calcarisporiella thermophila]|uniref:uncharacterized protein n=1 Tax=Calcarisporiella thermophila TaxID=911321 RepID=UPI003742FF92
MSTFTKVRSQKYNTMSEMNGLGIELLFTSGSFMTQMVLFRNIRSKEFLLLAITQFFILSEQVQYHLMKYNILNKNALTISTSIFWSISQILITFLYFRRLGIFSTRYIYLNRVLMALAIVFNILDSFSWASFAITNYTRDEYAILLSVSDILSGLIITVYEIISLHTVRSTLSNISSFEYVYKRIVHACFVTTALALGLYDMVMFGKKEFEKATDLNEMNLSIKLISYMLYYSILLSVKQSRSESTSRGISSSHIEYNPRLPNGTPKYCDCKAKRDMGGGDWSACSCNGDSIQLTAPNQAYNESDKYLCANSV